MLTRREMIAASVAAIAGLKAAPAVSFGKPMRGDRITPHQYTTGACRYFGTFSTSMPGGRLSHPQDVFLSQDGGTIELRPYTGELPDA